MVRRELRSYRCIHILPPPKKNKESRSQIHRVFQAHDGNAQHCTANYMNSSTVPRKNPEHTNPIGSMYAIYGNIYHQYTPNVSIYTIHGSYGYPDPLLIWNHMEWSIVSPHRHRLSTRVTQCMQGTCTSIRVLSTTCRLSPSHQS